MKILGIDYGTKTLGLAVCDDLGLMAHAIGMIKRKNLEHDLDALQQHIRNNRVERIVIGLPRNMDGSLGPAAQQVLEFRDVVKEHCNIPVDTWDERLSTVEAERLLIEADMSRSKRRKKVDTVAATIILQGYLDFISKNHSP